jgi:ABC-type sugar transport system ATPase subunit
MARVSILHLGKDVPGPKGKPPQRILGDVSLEIDDGEFLVLVGPSGCGKTTLLRCIAGLETITRGDLLLDGERVNALEPRERDIAMVFQSYALYPHLTVRDNLAFGLKMRGAPRDQIDSRIHQAATMLEITPYLERYPRQLSGGQRQRVAMGRAVVRRPRVFLFDEPLSNLDAGLRGQMRVELKQLHARLGATMIYVTHDQVEAMTLADRIAVLRAGALEQVGSPRTLYETPANLFVARFLGTPEMNTLSGQLRGGVWESEDLRVPLPGAEGLPSGLVTLGVRAEDVLIGAPQDAGHLPAQVEVTENLGWETLLHLKVGERGTYRLVARTETARAPGAGSTVGVAMTPAKVHLFDAGGMRLPFPPQASQMASAPQTTGGMRA